MRGPRTRTWSPTLKYSFRTSSSSWCRQIFFDARFNPHFIIYFHFSTSLSSGLTLRSTSRSDKPEFIDAKASSKVTGNCKVKSFVLKMHSRNSQNRISGSASRPPVSPFVLALFATMAAVYVAGRWVQRKMENIWFVFGWWICWINVW